MARREKVCSKVIWRFLQSRWRCNNILYKQFNMKYNIKHIQKNAIHKSRQLVRDKCHETRYCYLLTPPCSRSRPTIVPNPHNENRIVLKRYLWQHILGKGNNKIKTFYSILLPGPTQYETDTFFSSAFASPEFCKQTKASYFKFPPFLIKDRY